MNNSERARVARPKVHQDGWWDLICTIFWSTIASCLLLPWLLGSSEKHIERHAMAGAIIGTCFHFGYNRRQREKAKAAQDKASDSNAGTSA